MVKSWKETILKEYPRLSPGSKFRFSCRKGLSCFTQCCGDVNIFLSPYDVLRMKRALKLSSGKFLGKYTLPPLLADQKLPMVLLKMNDDAHKSCPFVTPEGCSIYEDRPWSCRMYPLGMASSKTAQRADGEEFCFVVEEEFSCLGLKEDKEWTVEEWWKNQGIDIYTKNNEALLDFGFDWLRFSLFGENTLKIRGDVAEEKRKELGLDSIE